MTRMQSHPAECLVVVIGGDGRDTEAALWRKGIVKEADVAATSSESNRCIRTDGRLDQGHAVDDARFCQRVKTVAHGVAKFCRHYSTRAATEARAVVAGVEIDSRQQARIERALDAAEVIEEGHRTAFDVRATLVPRCPAQDRVARVNAGAAHARHDLDRAQRVARSAWDLH